jgi:hypothetical protein
MLMLVGLMFFLPSCNSGDKPINTGVSAVAPEPVLVTTHLNLVPNADLTPMQWTQQWVGTPQTYSYQAINEVSPLDGDNIYTEVAGNYSRFGFSGIGNSPAMATAITVNLNVDYGLHQDDSCDLYVELYIGGDQIGSVTFPWCTKSPCIDDPQGVKHWSEDFEGLGLTAAEINSLEVRVYADFWWEHGAGYTHNVHIDNLYCDVTFESQGGKEPQPTE